PLVSVPELRRGDPLQGAVDVSQGPLQLSRHLAQHAAQFSIAVKHVFRHGTPPQCSLPPRQESTAGKSGQTMGQILTNSSGIIPKFCRNYKKIMGMSKFSQKVLFI